MAKIYGALEVAQLEWFTNAGKPAASSYPYRVIYVTDLKQIQVSDGTNWLPSNVTTYTSGTLPAASSANQYQVAFLTDTLQLRVSDGTKWTTVGARLDTYTSGTIPAAAANTNQMIWVSDLQQVQVSNGTSWVQVGSKVGSKNYFSQNNANPDFETNSVSPWSACTLTFSGSAPTGTPTLTATQMAISVSGTTPLAGTYSMLCTKSAANAQYQGFISGVLTIDREDVAKVMYGSFNYEVNSGTVDMSGTSTQTYEIWIYNVVGNQWIQPAGFRGMNQSSGSGKVVFSFQTDGSFANNQYRIAVITQQTSTAASVVEFDSFAVGPTAISVVQLRNPAGTIIATGSLTPPSGYLYCDGTAISRTDYAELFAAIGTTYGIGNGTTTFNIPDLRGIFARGAGTNPSNASNTTTIGTRQLDDFKGHTHTPNGGGEFIMTGGIGTNQNWVGGGASFNRAGVTGSTGGTETRPANVGVAYHICFSSGYVQMSNDTDTRVVAARYRRATDQSIPTGGSGATIIWNSQTFDTHAGMNTSTGVYTIPVSGFYRYTIGQRWASAAAGIRYATATFTGVNASRSGTPYNVFPTNGDFVTNSANDTLYFNAGDTISINGVQTSGGPLAFQAIEAGYFEIERLSGPSAIAASETVAARATNISGQSFANNTPTAITGWVKSYDTHNSFNTSTGTYTAPVSGKYTINASFLWAGASVAPVTQYSIYIIQNGTTQIELSTNFPTGTANTFVHLTGASTINCNAGDTVVIVAYQNSGGARAMASSGNFTYVNFTRVGN
jgi:microcystin-dependent protein/aspartate 1-decarboxylase